MNSSKLKGSLDCCCCVKFGDCCEKRNYVSRKKRESMTNLKRISASRLLHLISIGFLVSSIVFLGKTKVLSLKHALSRSDSLPNTANNLNEISAEPNTNNQDDDNDNKSLSSAPTTLLQVLQSLPSASVLAKRDVDLECQLPVAVSNDTKVKVLWSRLELSNSTSSTTNHLKPLTLVADDSTTTSSSSIVIVPIQPHIKQPQETTTTTTTSYINELNFNDELSPISLNEKIIAADKTKYFVSRQKNGQSLVLTVRQVNRFDDATFFLCQVSGFRLPTRIVTGRKVIVLEPPTITEANSSSSVEIAKVNSKQCLSCQVESFRNKATISWKREDGIKLVSSEIEISSNNWQANFGTSGQTNIWFEVTKLCFNKVIRKHLGAYLCIASNGIQAGVAKRFNLIMPTSNKKLDISTNVVSVIQSDDKLISDSAKTSDEMREQQAKAPWLTNWFLGSSSTQNHQANQTIIEHNHTNKEFAVKKQKRPHLSSKSQIRGIYRQQEKGNSSLVATANETKNNSARSNTIDRNAKLILILSLSIILLFT